MNNQTLTKSAESKEIELDDIIDITLEKLNSGGNVMLSPHGTSMLPMLRDGEDAVVLTKPNGRLHLFDIPLYRRDNGKYVMHRVVGFDADGSYVLRGDNQVRCEHGITDDNIIGVVCSFYRKGKAYNTNSLGYRFYVNFWYYTNFFRHVYRSGKSKSKRFLKKYIKAADDENNA